MKPSHREHYGSSDEIAELLKVRDYAIYEYFNPDETTRNKIIQDATDRQLRFSLISLEVKKCVKDHDIKPEEAADTAETILLCWEKNQIKITHTLNCSKSKIPKKYVEKKFWNDNVDLFQNDYYAGKKIVKILQYDNWVCLVLHFAHRWSSLIRKYLLREDVGADLKIALLKKCISYNVLINRRRAFGYAWHIESTTDEILKQGLQNPRGGINPLLYSDGSNSKNVNGQKEFILVQPDVVVVDVTPDKIDKSIYQDIKDSSSNKEIDITMVRSSFYAKNNAGENVEIRCYAFSGMSTNEDKISLVLSKWWKEHRASKYSCAKREIYICNKDQPPLSQNLLVEVFKAMRPSIEEDLWKLVECAAFEDEATATEIMQGNRSGLMIINYREFYDECKYMINNNNQFLKALAEPILCPMTYNNVKYKLKVCAKNTFFAPDRDFLNFDILDDEIKELSTVTLSGWNETAKNSLIKEIEERLDEIVEQSLIEVINGYLRRSEESFVKRIQKISVYNFDSNILIRNMKDVFDMTKRSLIGTATENWDVQTKNNLIKELQNQWKSEKKKRLQEVYEMNLSDKIRNKIKETLDESWSEKSQKRIINVISEIKENFKNTREELLISEFVKGYLSMKNFMKEAKKKVFDIYTTNLRELETELQNFKKDYLDDLEKRINKSTCGEDNVLTKLLQQYLSKVEIFNLSPVTFVAIDGNNLDGKPFCNVCDLKVKFYPILPFMLKELGMVTMGEDDDDYIKMLNDLLTVKPKVRIRARYRIRIRIYRVTIRVTTIKIIVK